MGSLTLMTPGIQRCWMGLARWFAMPVLFNQWIHSAGRIPAYPCVLCNQTLEFLANFQQIEGDVEVHGPDMMGSGHPCRLKLLGNGTRKSPSLEAVSLEGRSC